MSTFVLQPETLASFSQLVDYEISPCSLFQYGESAGLSEAQLQELIRQDVLDNNGQISSNASRAIKTLATASRFARIRFASSGNAFEYINYYSKDTQTYASVTNRDNGFLVEDPSDSNEIITGIQNLMGSSVLKSFDFEVELPELEAYILMAVVDLNRQHKIEMVLSSSTEPPIAIGTDAILMWLQNVPNDAQWFSSVLKDLLKGQYVLSLNQIQPVLDQLEVKGYIKKTGSDYQLANQAEGFMNQFVFTENMLSLFMGQANGEDVYQSGFIVVQAGVNDLLFIDSQDGVVQLEVISTTRLMSYLDQLVTHLADTQIAAQKPTYTLDIEKKVSDQETVETDSTTKVFCTECGVELNSDQKFCHQCGSSTVVEEKPTTCSNCQEKIKEGMAFCTNCGQKID